jgi:HAMP domain-containing protein
MNIRNRLLTWLLPTMIIFVAVIAYFFYLNWYQEIMASFRSRLQTVVVSSAKLLDPQDIAWIRQHQHEPHITSSPTYQRTYRKLHEIMETLPISDLYVISIEPVKKGEPVLLDKPVDEQNKIYDGIDKKYAYRQVYILDAGASDPNLPRQPDFQRPGDYDFSESQENNLYLTKEPFVTPIYESINQTRYMTAYAPVIDDDGKVVALVAADVTLKVIDEKLQRALGVILLCSGVIISLLAATIVFIATKISEPVEKLKTAALSLAAGEYGETIHVKGPKEIVELANTLNTLSECLQEHIARLRESSIARERMYGEYECALLLQHHMLFKVVDEYANPRLSMKLLKVASSNIPQGLLLKIHDASGKTHIEWIEADEPGFYGIYELLTSQHQTHYPRIQALIDPAESIQFKAQQMEPPLVWCVKTQGFVAEEGLKIPLHQGDLIFFFNRSFASQFQHQQQIQEWFAKVLRHFAAENLDSIATILYNELNFLTNKQHVEQDMYIFCVKVEQSQLTLPAQSVPSSSLPTPR